MMDALWLTCPACGQSFQIRPAGGNMQDALDVAEAHDAAHPGHLRTAPSAAVGLLEEALHLRMHGERAPGGNETWREWDRKAEAFLRARLAGDTKTGPPAHP